MLQALEKMSERAMPEFAPFAATLAQRLTKLVAAGRLAPDQPMWELAVDRFLVLAVDTEGQVSSRPDDASSQQPRQGPPKLQCSLPAGCSLCQALNALPVSQSVAVQGLAHLLKRGCPGA